MKWQLVLLLFISCALYAEKTLWFHEEAGSTMYRKCVLKKKGQREYAAVNTYLLISKEQKESKDCVLIYEQKLWSRDGKFEKQIFINHTRKQKITLTLDKNAFEMETQTAKGQKHKKKTKRPRQPVYVSLIAKIYNHPDIFTIGKKFRIYSIPMPVNSIEILEYQIKVLPKSKIPNSKKNKLYYVAQFTEVKLPENKRLFYYDENGHIVYSTFRGKYPRKRIAPPNIKLDTENQPKEKISYTVNDIAPTASIRCKETYYSHSYPRSWNRVNLKPFSSAYRGKSGTIGVLSERTTVKDHKVFMENTLEKLKKNNKDCDYDTVAFTDKREILIGKHAFVEFIIKCDSSKGNKYFLILSAIGEERSYAVVVFGAEYQYHTNWPTWLNTLHSFIPIF